MDGQFIQQSVQRPPGGEFRPVPDAVLGHHFLVVAADEQVDFLGEGEGFFDGQGPGRLAVEKQPHPEMRVVHRRHVMPGLELENPRAEAAGPFVIGGKLQAEVPGAVETERIAAGIAVALGQDRRPIPRVGGQRHPGLQGESMRQRRHLVGLAAQQGGEAVTAQASAAHAPGQEFGMALEGVGDAAG